MVDEMTAITSSGENFSVAPNTVNAKFVRENETIRAEQFDWKSKFGSASGKEEMHRRVASGSRWTLRISPNIYRHFLIWMIG